MNIELGLNKKVRRAYGIDEIALVPGKRTLDYDLTDPSWFIGDLKREVPIIASAMDSVVDVNTAVELTKLGALGVINMEGIQTRYENPDEILSQIASVGKNEFVPLMQNIYSGVTMGVVFTKNFSNNSCTFSVRSTTSQT